MKSIYLENTSANSKTGNRHNKFYCMDQADSKVWYATYGRIGAPGKTTEYLMSEWNNKLSEKMKKGYVVVIHAVDRSIFKRMDQLIKLLDRTGQPFRVDAIKDLQSKYTETAIIRKADMHRMNKYYKEALNRS